VTNDAFFLDGNFVFFFTCTLTLFSATDLSPICLDSSCGVCDFEKTPSNVLTN